MESTEYWMLMTCSFVLERLVAECRPPAKGKKTKPERWTAAEQKRLIESMREWLSADGAPERRAHPLRPATATIGLTASLSLMLHSASQRRHS
jgi:hypothetical protein